MFGLVQTPREEDLSPCLARRFGAQPGRRIPGQCGVVNTILSSLCKVGDHFCWLLHVWKRVSSGQVSLDDVISTCLTQLHRKWPSMRCASLLEGSIHLSLRARASVSTVLETDPIRVNASSGTREVILVLVPVQWSWECQSTLSREVLFLHIPGRHFGGDETANTLEDMLDFLPHHTAAAMATSQAPQRLERARVAPLSHSCSCTVVAWILAHWAKAACYLSSISEPLAMRPLSVSNDCLRSLSPSECSQAQEMLVKQICRRVTHRGSDVQLDSSQLMRPDVWPRRPTAISSPQTISATIACTSADALSLQRCSHRVLHLAS